MFFGKRVRNWPLLKQNIQWGNMSSGGGRSVCVSRCDGIYICCMASRVRPSAFGGQVGAGLETSRNNAASEEATPTGEEV